MAALSFWGGKMDQLLPRSYDEWLEFFQLLVLFVAAVAALAQIEIMRRVSSKRSTLELLSDAERDRDVIAQRGRFLELRNDREISLSRWAELRENELERKRFIEKRIGTSPSAGKDETKTAKWVEQSKNIEKEIFENNEAIRYVLNRHEMLAIAIDLGAVSEKMVKRYQRGIIITDWNRAKEYIEMIRKYGSAPSAYIEFQSLALKWERDLLRQDMRKRRIR